MPCARPAISREGGGGVLGGGGGGGGGARERERERERKKISMTEGR